jgi:hypothetical protein
MKNLLKTNIITLVLILTVTSCNGQENTKVQSVKKDSTYTYIDPKDGLKRTVTIPANKNFGAIEYIHNSKVIMIPEDTAPTMQLTDEQKRKKNEEIKRKKLRAGMNRNSKWKKKKNKK